MLTATVLTVLGIWLFKTVAPVFVLLMLGILISLYLGAVADWLREHLRVPDRLALAVAILGSLGGLVLLMVILVPPVIDQARQLVQQMPVFIASWEKVIDNLAVRFPALQDMIGPPGAHKTVAAISEQLTSVFSSLPTKVLEFVEAAISIFAVGVMGIYLALHPALYREWLIALFPPIHRDLVRDVLAETADALRAYIVGQLMTMTFLGAITALGLYVLNVPFWGVFGIFTGLVAIVPFFGTLLSTTLPALFVLTGQPFHGIRPFGHAMLVVGLGVVVHLIEGNIVSPLVMSKKVDLPPVLTIMAVLVIGQLLGGLGLIIALPTLAAIMVIVRRILITRIYEGQGFRKTTRERPLILRVPVPGGGVVAMPGMPFDVVTSAERAGIKRSA
jgi:predicted PurR-regulated permease PerM